jgi:TRAP-type C4-dicarboxylate transport system substrate-binding protein
MSEYVSMVNFQYLPQVMWVRVDYWESLPQNIRDAMIEVGKETALYEQKVDQEMHQEFRDAITKRGTEIIDLTPAQMAEWQAASKSVYTDPAVTKHTPLDLLDRLRKAGELGG